MSGIPDDANFCPACGTQIRFGKWEVIDASKCSELCSCPNPSFKKNTFLYEGKGTVGSVKGYFVVDIRQCRRTDGLGWDGRYEFPPGLPVGYNGFYAMFDQSEDIQVLISDGKISTLFFISKEYTLKIWRGEKEEKYQELEEGWFFNEWVTKYRYNTVTYFGFFENDHLLPNGSDAYKNAEKVLSKILDKCKNTYSKEFNNFFGVTWNHLTDDMEGFSENSD